MLTPDGNKYNPRDPETLNECWITKTSHPNLAALNADPTKEPYLEEMILAACASVNEICNRKFNAQLIDYIFKDRNLFFQHYLSFALPNLPLISIENVWLNVVETFSEVSLDYLQVMTAEGIFKILPNFTAYTQTTLPLNQLSTATNLWVRYRGGFEVDQDSSVNEVPKNVQMATALYVSYLFSSFDVESGVESFRTQTYSQKNVVDADKDPVLTRINNLLKPYRIFNAL